MALGSLGEPFSKALSLLWRGYAEARRRDFSRRFVATAAIADVGAERLSLRGGRSRFADAVLLHTSESPPESSSARTTVPLSRHCRYPSDSDADVKPEPCTVRGVPPSADPCTGHTDDTATAPVYVYATPNDVNCWPFRLTSIDLAEAPADTGDAHSSWYESTYRADTVAPDPRPKRHTSVDDSRK